MAQTTGMKFSYPSANRDDSLIDTIFGKQVPDPYRWLENPDSEETKQFVDKQNSITMPYIEKCQHRVIIKQRLTENMDYEKYGSPFKRGGKYYFYKNSGLQNQSVLYQQDTLSSTPRTFFDPNTLSQDGTIALSVTGFSDDGKWFAYGLSYSGSDWIEIKVKNVETGEDLAETLKRCKFTSIEWTHDNKGFFYAQYPHHHGKAAGTETDSNKNHSLFYHKINTPQEEDKLMVNFPEHPKWNIGFQVSDDGNYLHVFLREGCQDNQWFIADLRQADLSQDKLAIKPIYDKFGAEIEYVTNNDQHVFVRTNLNAKNYRVAKVDINNPDVENWLDIIPNHPQDVLDWAEAFTVDSKDYLLVNYLRKVVYYLELYGLDGKLIRKFTTPMGTIAKYPARRSDGEFFFQFTSFLTPGTTYHFDLTGDILNSEPVVLRQANPKNFNPDEFVIEQIFYKSKDGTEVPMFLVHRKDLEKNGQNPCLLYGYGGFNIMITSTFNINRLVWLKNFNGIFAVANIRGGGELGQAWHDSGRLLNKQNVFDDFSHAAKFLIENKYTNRDKLAIEGGSNGGLLVAASSNQRPDLFGASICHVGVLDMIRFASFTIGHAWISDYGSPDEEKYFNNLLSYSPYHNIPPVDMLPERKYPATLLLTADHDDRVVPAHSLKFIAQLQHKLGNHLNDTPLLIRVDTKSGHGAGRPLTKTIDEYADIYCFLHQALGLTYNDK